MFIFKWNKIKLMIISYNLKAQLIKISYGINCPTTKFISNLCSLRSVEATKSWSKNFIEWKILVNTFEVTMITNWIENRFCIWVYDSILWFHSILFYPIILFNVTIVFHETLQIHFNSIDNGERILNITY